MNIIPITDLDVVRTTKRYKQILDQIMELETSLYDLHIKESEIYKVKIKLERERQEIETRAIEGL